MTDAAADEATNIGDHYHEDRTFPPSEEFRSQATLSDPAIYERAAADPVEFWAERAGCDVASPVVGETLDLEDILPGAETEVLHFEGCDEPGYAFSLYTIVDGSHLPISTKSKNLSRRTLDWLLAQRRGGATP